MPPEIEAPVARLIEREILAVEDSVVEITDAGREAHAPDIQAAIVIGRQPADLNLEMLQDMKQPIARVDQSAVLGFSRPASL